MILSFLKHRPKAKAIKNDMHLPWLELDIAVPYDNILNEFNNIKDQVVKHRSSDRLLNQTHKGWNSLTIHGVDATTTEAKEGLNTWTSVADQCPQTKQWIQQNFIINEQTGRIRFMYLEPGGWIMPHKDRDVHKLYEINVAISNPKGCVFRMLERGNIPFAPGKAFIIDTANKHMIHNDSDQPRLHIILHTDIDDKVIERSYANCYYS
tara:strand:- start:76 stop:699 length:624 start_codon:yes stop_codon:yes gene_type:complete